MRRALLPAVALAALLCTAAAPGDPADALRDPAQEAHAHVLFRQVRCLVCQNESIDDSEAPLASDLRQIVRAQVAAGRSDAEIKAYLDKRYGEFVLMRPAFSAANAALWLGPFAVVLLGGVVVLARRRKSTQVQGADRLSPEEEERLRALAASPIPKDTVPPHAGQTADPAV